MVQFYSDPSRESDPHTLPDCEVFYVTAKEAARNAAELAVSDEREGLIMDEPGFYYWFCFPGCMPDSDPTGPFESEAAAIKYVREMYAD